MSSSIASANIMSPPKPVNATIGPVESEKENMIHSGSSNTEGKKPMRSTAQTLTEPQFGRLRHALLTSRNVNTNIPGLGPAVDVVPWEMVRHMYKTLRDCSIAISSVNLEGSAAAHVIDENAFSSYNDLDVVFVLDSQERSVLESIRGAVMASLQRFTPATWNGTPASWVTCGAVIGKMWITPSRTSNDEDAWAIFTVGVAGSATDLKFVQKLNRPYQFTIDSFRLDLTALLNLSLTAQPKAKRQSSAPAGLGQSETNIKPNPSQPPAPLSYASMAAKLSRQNSSVERITEPAASNSVIAIVGASVALSESHELHSRVHITCSSGSIRDALKHLKRKHICVNKEDDLALVRGGGLLKYISYLQKEFQCDPKLHKSKMHKYMVNRFLCDYPPYEVTRYGNSLQLQVLTDYFNSHFAGEGTDIVRRRLGFLQKLFTLVQSVQNSVNLVEPLLQTILFMQQYINMHDAMQARNATTLTNGNNNNNMNNNIAAAAFVPQTYNTNDDSNSKVQNGLKDQETVDEATDSDACSVNSEISGDEGQHRAIAPVTAPTSNRSRKSKGRNQRNGKRRVQPHINHRPSRA